MVLPSGSNKVLYAFRLLFISSSFCVRMSVILLYYRLARHFEKPYARWILHAIAGAKIGMTMWFMFALAFTCM